MIESAPKEFVVMHNVVAIDTGLNILNHGKGILWEGDYFHGTSYLSHISKLFDEKTKKPVAGNIRKVFKEERKFLALRAKILSRFTVRVFAGHSLRHLRRAPDNATAALDSAFGDIRETYVTPLREVLGAMGSWEWRKEGVMIPILEDRIYPHFGVFCPTVRNDYVKLISTVPISEKAKLAYDIGVGTGVLSAILVKRGVNRVVATDICQRALDCADENLTRLGFKENVQLIKCSVYPKAEDIIGEKPDLIVCNPPWLPYPASRSLIDKAVYDENSAVLRQYLNGIQTHLGDQDHCEAFLILSDLAERFNLRSSEKLHEMFAEANLRVVEKIDAVACHHPKRENTVATSRISAARSKELTSIWRLKVKNSTQIVDN